MVYSEGRSKMKLLSTYFTRQPREIFKNRILVFSKLDMMMKIRDAGFMTSCYTSIYSFERVSSFNKPDYDSAIIDKIFFDLDGDSDKTHKNMLKLHETLLEDDILHFTVYSGGGFHVYAITDEQNGVRDKKNALRSFQEYYAKKANLSYGGPNKDIDSNSIFGNVAQIARLPNTFNPRRGRFSFLIPTSMVNDYSAIVSFSDPKNFKPIKNGMADDNNYLFGNKKVNLRQFENERKDKIVVKFDSDSNYVSDDEGFCPHVAKFFKQRSGRDAWFAGTIWLRERGYSRTEANEILKKYLSVYSRTDRPGKNDYEHAIMHDKILDTVYGSNGDKYLFPTAELLIERGLTDGVCLDCAHIYLHRKNGNGS